MAQEIESLSQRYIGSRSSMLPSLHPPKAKTSTPASFYRQSIVGAKFEYVFLHLLCHNLCR